MALVLNLRRKVKDVSDVFGGITRFGVSEGRLIALCRRWTDDLRSNDDAVVLVDFAALERFYVVGWVMFWFDVTTFLKRLLLLAASLVSSCGRDGHGGMSVPIRTAGFVRISSSFLPLCDVIPPFLQSLRMLSGNRESFAPLDVTLTMSYRSLVGSVSQAMASF